MIRVSSALPILQMLLERRGGNHLKALVLTPTRELTKQVHTSARGPDNSMVRKR